MYIRIYVGMCVYLCINVCSKHVVCIQCKCNMCVYVLLYVYTVYTVFKFRGSAQEVRSGSSILRSACSFVRFAWCWLKIVQTDINL